MELITPLPIVFEVYKLLAQRESSAVAQAVLQQMMETTVIPMTLADFKAISQMMGQLTDWKGALEDTAVLINCSTF
ncbi:MAG: hypothetical protein AAF329_23790 [Cyanobacteria bacterium P01_A01_bin.17]